MKPGDMFKDHDGAFWLCCKRARPEHPLMVANVDTGELKLYESTEVGGRLKTKISAIMRIVGGW